MAALPGTDIAQDVGQIAAAVLAVSAAMLLLPRAVKVVRSWAVERRRARDDDLRDTITTIAEHTASHATQELTDKLFSPNGGRSLYDISQRVELALSAIEDVRGDLRAVAQEQSAQGKRTDRIERQLDDIVIPKQADIASKLQADRRSTD